MFRASELRRLVSRMIADQPIYLTSWVKLAGDGITGAVSWEWSESWRTRQDTVGRGVFEDRATTIGTAASRTTTILLPYESGKTAPVAGDWVRLQSLEGDELGDYRVIQIQPFYDSSGAIWKYDLTVEEQQ